MPVRPTIRLWCSQVGAFSLPVLIDLNLGNVSSIVVSLRVVVWRWLDRPVGSIAACRRDVVRARRWGSSWSGGAARPWRPVAWTLGAGLVIIVLTLPFAGFAATSTT